MLYQVLDGNGELKSFEDLNLVNGPIKMEYEAMKVAVGKKVEYLKTFCKTNFDKLLLWIRPIISNFNVYGRIVFKRKRGCAHYYRLINASRKKHDGWNTPCNSLENEISIDCPNWVFSKDMFYENVQQI